MGLLSDYFENRRAEKNNRQRGEEQRDLRKVEALEQIAIVCTDNMGRSCDHRMALDFVRQIANDALDLSRPPRGGAA